MTIATLVKVVPDLEEISFDPTTRTMYRSGKTLYLNPFDARAAILAPTLRTGDEESVIVCMGPPDARRPITEALALGSDRGLLVSDRALAGSDTSVTSRVLAKSLNQLAPNIILAGRWSTDASTGQVPSQVAELLGMPLVDGARRIERRTDGTLEVQGETERGWARYRVRPPCMITVTEKLVKMRHPKPDDLKSAEGKPLAMMAAADLGFNASEIGLAGSPTKVVGLENEEPNRSPNVFGDGSVAQRVEQAIGKVLELRSRFHAPDPGLRPPPSTLGEEGEVLVFASGSEGGVDPEALPLISEVLRLPPPLWPSVVGFGEISPKDRSLLARAGAARAYWATATTGWHSPDLLSGWVTAILKDRPKCVGFLVLSTSWGRQLAGRVSASLGAGLTGDAVNIHYEPGEGLAFSKPSFGGGLIAKVVTNHPPAMATIRPGSFPEGRLDRGPDGITIRSVPIPDAAARLERTENHVETGEEFGDLDHAGVVIGVGMGIGGPSSVPQVLQAVHKLGGALAASRKVVDAGWVPYQLQVGLTGKSIAPELYVGVGVSGAVNHLVGVKRARITLGINSNPSAPLFQRVDVGIVGDWQEILPRLADGLAPHVAALGGNPRSERDGSR